MRFRQLHCVTIVVTMLVVGACDSMRPHDEARAKTAAELVAISATITEGGEFEAMKENLKPVIAAQTRLQKLERANDWEQFLDGAADMSADNIADELVIVLGDRLRLLQAIDRETRGASDEINASIEQRKALAAVLDDRLTAADRSDPQKTLERIATRMAKARDVLGKLQGFLDEKSGSAGSAAATAAEAGGSAGAFLEIGEEALKAAKNDPVLRDAVALAARAAKELLDFELRRLREHRLYLRRVQAISGDVAARSDQMICHLLLPVLEMVGPGILDAETQAALKAAYNDLHGRNDCIEGAAWQDDDLVREDWGEGTVASFVSARLTRWKANVPTTPRSPRAAQLVGALGILLYGDLEFLENQELALARAKHSHSIDLSQINASGHAVQVHQLAQGLEVYYRGGIRAEDIAGIFAALAQVGALTYIGAQE